MESKEEWGGIKGTVKSNTEGSVIRWSRKKGYGKSEKYVADLSCIIGN